MDECHLHGAFVGILGDLPLAAKLDPRQVALPIPRGQLVGGHGWEMVYNQGMATPGDPHLALTHGRQVDRVSLHDSGQAGLAPTTAIFISLLLNRTNR